MEREAVFKSLEATNNVDTVLEFLKALNECRSDDVFSKIANTPFLDLCAQKIFGDSFADFANFHEDLANAFMGIIKRCKQLGCADFLSVLNSAQDVEYTNAPSAQAARLIINHIVSLRPDFVDNLQPDHALSRYTMLLNFAEKPTPVA